MPAKTADLVLYRDPRFYASFPSVEALPDGGALVVFRRGREARRLLEGIEDEGFAELRQKVDHIDPRAQLVQLRLDADLAATGEPVMLPPDPEASDQDASLLRLRDGTLLLGSFSWYPLPATVGEAIREHGGVVRGGGASTQYLFWGANLRRSADDGATWTDPEYLPPRPGGREIVPGLRPLLGGGLRGAGVELNGEVLVATYGFEQGPSGSHLYASGDGGRTCEYRARIAFDEARKIAFQEPALLALPDGRLMAFLRTTGLEDRLATAESSDGGRNWSTSRQHEVVGHPFHPLRLPDGRVLLTYGYRHEPYGIRARLLAPDCSDLDTAEEFVIRDDGACADLGYPWATSLADGRVLVVYYFTGEDGLRHIAGSVLET